MQYVRAFEALGYRPTNPRQDWSAENENGVCVTFWKSEVKWTPAPPKFDLWQLHPGGESDWNEFEGWIDAVIVTGVPGNGVKDAMPWKPDQRMDHRWRITRFDPDSGYFSAAAEQRK